MSEFTNYGGQQVPALQITTGLYPSTATPLDIRTYVKTKSILESSEPVGCHLHIGMQIYVEDTNEYVTIVGQRPNTSGAQWNHWIFDIIIPQLIASLEADKQNDPSTYAQIKSGVYTTENLINYLFIKCGGPITPVHTVTINFLYSDETVARDPVYLTVLEGATYSFNVYEITGYAPDRQVVSGTMGDSDISEDVIYSAIPYTLTYMVEHGGETYQTYNNVLYNTAVEVPSTPPEKSGYNFNGWEYVPELIDNQYMPASNVTAYGIWTEIIPDCVVTLNVVPSDSGSVTGAGSYTNGDNVVLTATPAEGFDFVNWVDADSSEVISTETPCTITSINRDWNINANFSREMYTVTTSVSPTGSGTTTGDGSYNAGDYVTLTATANTGYTFRKWTKDNVPQSESATYNYGPIQSNCEFVAEFSINEYNVSLRVDPSGAGTVNGNGTYEYGDDVTLTATPASGYNFAAWLENDEVVSTNATYTIEDIAADHELVAKFAIDQFTVMASANPNDGGTVSGGGTYDSGDSCTVTATAVEGHTFTNWTENNVEVSTSASYTFTVSGNRTLVANFSLNQYTVELDVAPSAGGTVTGNGTYNYGSNVNLTATPATGYQFVNWTSGGTVVSTNANYTIGGIREDIRYTANFSLLTYTVDAEVNPQNSGTVSGTGTFNYGTDVTLTASPASGYNFVNWTENEREVGRTTTYIIQDIAENHRLTANFEVAGYTVTTSVDPANSGTVTGGGTYLAGSTVRLSATPARGYRFSYWQDTTEETPLTSNPDLEINNLSRDMNIVAHFSQLEQVTVSLSVSPANSGTVTGNGTYYVGDDVTLSATPATGYNFLGWYDTRDTLVNSNASYTITGINQNTTLVAKFAEIQSYNVYAFGIYDNDIDAAGGLRSLNFTGKPSVSSNVTDNVYAAVIPALDTSELQDGTRYAVVAIPTDFTYETGSNFFKAQSMPGDTIVNYGMSGYYEPITRVIDGVEYYIIVSDDIEEEEVTTLLFGNTNGLTSWSDAIARAVQIGGSNESNERV